MSIRWILGNEEFRDGWTQPASWQHSTGSHGREGEGIGELPISKNPSTKLQDLNRPQPAWTSPEHYVEGCCAVHPNESACSRPCLRPWGTAVGRNLYCFVKVVEKHHIFVLLYMASGNFIYPKKLPEVKLYPCEEHRVLTYSIEMCIFLKLHNHLKMLSAMCTHSPCILRLSWCTTEV